MIVELVVAHDLNSGIGRDGEIPWDAIKGDIQFFKRLTTDTLDPSKLNMVIMGRKTYESIPLKFRPLPGRVNVVLSSLYKEGVYTDIVVCKKIDDITTYIQTIQPTIETVYIIGGQSVYDQFLPYCSKLHVTVIKKTHKCDRFFYIPSAFKRLSTVDHDLYTLDTYTCTPILGWISPPKTILKV
jgi:dihydrofolate reductase/thymidylate synthase